MSLAQEMLDYCERTGTAHSTLGRLMNGDWRLVQGVVNGRKIGPRVYALIVSFMAENPNGFPRVEKAPTQPKPKQSESQAKVNEAKIRVASERLRKATIFVRPEDAAPRAPLSFEEQIARVAAGKATISPTFQRHHLTPTVRPA